MQPHRALIQHISSANINKPSARRQTLERLMEPRPGNCRESNIHSPALGLLQQRILILQRARPEDPLLRDATLCYQVVFLLLRPNCRVDLGADMLRVLDSRETQTTCSGLDEYALAGFQLRQVIQGIDGRAMRDADSGHLNEVRVVGQLQALLRRAAEECIVVASFQTDDLVAGLEMRDAASNSRHIPGALVAGLDALEVAHCNHVVLYSISDPYP